MSVLNKLEEIERKITEGEKVKKEDVNLVIKISQEQLITYGNRCTERLKAVIIYLFVLYIFSPSIVSSEEATIGTKYLILAVAITYTIYMLNYIITFYRTTAHLKVLNIYKEQINE